MLHGTGVRLQEIKQSLFVWTVEKGIHNILASVNISDLQLLSNEKSGT